MIEIRDIPNLPYMRLGRAQCDLCASSNFESHFDVPLVASPRQVFARELRRANWIEDLAGRIVCPACQGANYRVTTDLLELLRDNPSTLADTLVVPVRNIVQTITAGRAIPEGAEEIHHLAMQALSRSHPYEPEGLRDDVRRLRTLLRSAGNVPHTLFNPEQVQSILRGNPLQVVALEAIPPGRVALINQDSVLAVHPSEAEAVHEQITSLLQAAENDPDLSIFTNQPLVGFSRVQSPLADETKMATPKSSWERLLEDDDPECR